MDDMLALLENGLLVPVTITKPVCPTTKLLEPQIKVTWIAAQTK